MKRIQFYPSSELEQKLEEEAQTLGISVSALVNEKLSSLYGIGSNKQLPISVLTNKVLEEIKVYINTPGVPKEFDILTVSKTFKNIEMSCNGKPSAVRAQIGRNFKNQIGHGDFSNVRRAYHDNKKPKLSKNNAIVYKIT
jgi:hypothetical protein